MQTQAHICSLLDETISTKIKFFERFFTDYQSVKDQVGSLSDLCPKSLQRLSVDGTSWQKVKVYDYKI